MVPLWCPFCHLYNVIGGTCATCGAEPRLEHYDDDAIDAVDVMRFHDARTASFTGRPSRWGRWALITMMLASFLWGLLMS